jgi:hypothetical protein
MQRRWTDGRATATVAAEIAKPNDRLTSFERLEIYNRMYWFRVLDSLYEDCPGLRAVLGDKKFIRLAEAYLVKYPSGSFTLRNLPSRLARFIREEPRFTAPHTALCHDLARFEWARVEVFDTAAEQTKELALYPAERAIPAHVASGVQVCLNQFTLHRPRQWGACWVACKLWSELRMDEFWGPLLPASREGTNWKNILQTLTIYRLLDPGSEWRLHRQWFQNSALADLLQEDFALAEKDNLYRCLDKLLAHRAGLFKHLRQRWEDLFNTPFDVLLYDLTSTYFESDPPFPEGDKRRFGYSRDKRSDCVQVIVALIVTAEGFPLAYEVLPGNTSDKTTLQAFLEKVEQLYGKAERIWIMDRGIPTKKVLELMRAADPRTFYLVGTPRQQLTKLEAQLTQLPWQKVREQVEVKLLRQDKELYVLARSRDRMNKERAMRRRKLKDLWKRLGELQRQKRLDRDELLLKLGRAQEQAGQAFKLVELRVPGKNLQGQGQRRQSERPERPLAPLVSVVELGLADGALASHEAAIASRLAEELLKRRRA